MSNNIENIELRSEDVQEILTKVPNWMIRWGSVLFLLLILLLLLISWFVKYPDIISSEALVTTQTPPQKIYTMVTGKLNVILVEDNQKVKPNTPLAIIENTANYNDVFKLKSIIDTIKVNNKYFSFPIDNLPVLFLGDIESDFALFENNYIQYCLNKELQPFSNEVIANQFSVSQLYTRLENLKSQKKLYASELNLKKKNLDRNKSLFNKRVISAQDYENVQLKYLQAERNYNNMNVSISQIREAISNAKNTSIGTEISRTKEEIILLKNVIQSFNQLKKSIKDWELYYMLQSNINGKVSFLKYWNKNQTVNQGDLVFTIIPTENAEFIAKLKAPLHNSGKIKIGQKVNIKLENYPDYEFGILKGKVKNISMLPDKDGFYLIDVTLPQKLITSYNKEIEFKQEMRGVAEIITKDLRLIERFFYQFKKALN